MADPQEIKNIIESVVAKVFEKRIPELRKDLHRGVGESLGSRVSELQLDVETGVAEIFSGGVERAKKDISSGVTEALNGQITELRSDIEKGVTDSINSGANEIKSHVEQGMGEILSTCALELKREIEAGVGGIFDQRVNEMHQEIQRVVAEVTGQRLAGLRREIEQAVEGTTEKRILDLRNDVERVVSQKTDHGVQELRKSVHKVVADLADKRIASLRHDVENIVGGKAEESIQVLRKDVERVVGEVAENRVSSLRKDVERVVAEAGQHHVDDMRKDLVHKVAEELEPATKGKTSEAPVSALLDSAITTIQESSSQTDILRALLDGAAHFSSRVGLFVVKGSAAAGWQARGFDDNNTIKKVTVDATNGLTGRAIQERKMVTASAAEFDGKFVAEFGGPKKGNATLTPLLVRDKVPALIYADSGVRSDGEIDVAALQLLVRTAGLWLEMLSLRKASGSSAAAVMDAPVVETPSTPVQAPQAAAAAVASADSSHAAKPAPAHAEPAPIPAGDEEIHKKAKRFAKLLVDEIKLYNQAKVNEGRQHKDLYSRLKEDIDKSRASYEKRYGNTPAASADYFNQEVIKVLAENDAAVLGSSYPR